MNEQDKGFTRILSAVLSRKPKLQPNDAREVARIVMRKLNDIVASGDVLAFLRKDKNGVVDELITYTLKEKLK